MNEKKIQTKIQTELSKLGCRMFRNQVGVYKLPDGRVISSGLCKGASDLIGITPYVVKADDIGRVVGVFTAIEVKTKNGKVRAMQEKFVNFVRSIGGIGLIARDCEATVETFKQFVK